MPRIITRTGGGLLLLIAACALALVAGCGSGSPRAQAPTPPPTAAARVPSARAAFKADIQPIFGARCAICHIQQQLGALNLGSDQGLVTGG